MNAPALAVSKQEHPCQSVFHPWLKKRFQGSKTLAWLQLFRAPNLLTVPGDPLAGYFLASFPPATLPSNLFLAMGTSLCFYSAGLLLNDLADFKIDQIERPNRPLPSGKIPKGQALFVAVCLLGLGGFLCNLMGGTARWVGGGLLLMTLAYDFGIKNFPIIGPLNMGFCRGLSLLLGVAAFSGNPGFFTPLVLAAAAILTLYIAGVSCLARSETRNEKIPVRIGHLISGLLLIQAIFVFISGAGSLALKAGLILIALWPINRLINRWFYAS